LGIDPGLDPVFRIGPAIEVLGKQLLAPRVRDEILQQQVELGGVELDVLVPPHRLLGRAVTDDELVLGRAAGMYAGLRRQRPAWNDRGLPVGDRVLIERGLGEIPVDRLETLEAKLVSAISAVPQPGFLHETPPQNRPASGWPDAPLQPAK